MASSLWRYFSDLKNFLRSYFLCFFLYQTLTKQEKTWPVCVLSLFLWWWIQVSACFCFLFLVLFISLRVLLQIVMSMENTHTSPVERLPGLLMCASICVHSVISPRSGRNWRITDLDWMLPTSGGCLFPVVDKHRLNHCLLNQSAHHNDYGIITAHLCKIAGETLAPYCFGILFKVRVTLQHTRNVVEKQHLIIANHILEPFWMQFSVCACIKTYFKAFRLT